MSDQDPFNDVLDTNLEVPPKAVPSQTLYFEEGWLEEVFGIAGPKDVGEIYKTLDLGIYVKDIRSDYNPCEVRWPEGLFHFKGSEDLFFGLQVFYDFPWQYKVDHGKKKFKCCKTLARFAKENETPEKPAALILTSKKQPAIIFDECRRHTLLIVSIDDYLSREPPDAKSYYHSCNPVDLQVVQKLKDNPDLIKFAISQDPGILKKLLEADPDYLKTLLDQNESLLQQVVNENLVTTNIDFWAKQDPDRLNDLQAILDGNRSDAERRQKTFDQLLKHWATSAIDDREVISLVNAVSSNSQLSSLIKALAAKSEELSKLKPIGSDGGERMVAAALRTSHRTDALNRLKKFIAEEELEPKFQKLFDANWWMFGRHYVRRIANRDLAARSQIDILLQSADNYYDLFELKRSKEDLFKSYNEDRSIFVVNHIINDAVTQTVQYIYTLERHLEINRAPPNKLDLLRLNTYIVVGHIADDDPESHAKREALRLYNSHLHRIKIVTYDEIVRIAEQVIKTNKGEMEIATQLETQFEKEDEEKDKAAQKSLLDGLTIDDF